MASGNDDNQRKKPRGMRRDRDCRSCKLRGIKCDLNRPRCLPCVQASLVCGGYPQRVVWTGDSSTKAQIVKPKQTRPTRKDLSSPTHPHWPTTTPVTTQVEKNGYVQPTTISEEYHDIDQNSFIKCLVESCHQALYEQAQSPNKSRYLSPEAIRLVSHLCDLLQARSGESPRDSTDETRASLDVERHRLEALIDLNKALETANPFAILGIAAFALFDIFDGSFGDWQCHLYGARSLLDYHCRTRAEFDQLSLSVPGLADTVARLVWWDVMGSIIRNGTKLIFDEWHREILDQRFFSIVGCASDTFDIFVRLANAEIASDPLGGCILAMDQLFKWGSDPTSWGQITNAYRCAVAIAVLGQVTDEATTVAKQAALASAVDRLCQIIASMPSSSKFYIHLAVPTYLAGINAINIHQCEVVRAYWQDCSLGSISRYSGGLAKCEEIWKTKKLI